MSEPIDEILIDKHAAAVNPELEKFNRLPVNTLNNYGIYLQWKCGSVFVFTECAEC